eukprot:3649954-Pleurochrysis_carterae.AAC.2
MGCASDVHGQEQTFRAGLCDTCGRKSGEGCFRWANKWNQTSEERRRVLGSARTAAAAAAATAVSDDAPSCHETDPGSPKLPICTRIGWRCDPDHPVIDYKM